jgi:hypothetical protein
MVSELRERVRTMREATRTSFRRLRGGANYRRWGNSSSLSPDWDSRTEQIAGLIAPGASVLEFGAGRMALLDHLPEGCRYTPSDLVDRGNGTIVCDLNARELPPFPPHDVAVFSGVLEYINDLSYLIVHVSKFVGVIITSYADAEHVSSTLVRRSQGWVNDYQSSQFEEIFARSGFRCDRVEDWRNQKIYRFVRARAGGTSSND